MTVEGFINPITLSFNLLERYKLLLQDNLHLQGLSSDDIAAVLSSIEVDQGLYFSINRQYRYGQTGFRQLCRDHAFADSLPDYFPTLKRLYVHQENAIHAIRNGKTTIISTGTGSGKTEAFLVPILDYCLKHPGPGIKALIIYPMNALANDQVRRLHQATRDAGPASPVRCEMLVGSTSDRDRNALRANPPDILITNYVMLDWMLTRADDRRMLNRSCATLRYLVLDEIHTYRGNKATHLKYLLARLKALLDGPLIQIGTSATLQSPRTGVEGYFPDDQKRRDDFIKPLLDVTEYEFVEPDYAPEPEIVPSALHVPDLHDLAALGWTLEVDPETGLQNLGRLTGQRYSLLHLGDTPEQSRPYQDLQRHPFIQQLRRALRDGSQSFVELVQLMAGLLPPQHPVHAPEALVKALLSATAYINEQFKKEPLLDFRVHLFWSDPRKQCQLEC